MEAGRPRFEAERAKRDELAQRFLGAFHDGDVAALRELLAADVNLIGDAGGKAPLFAERIVGVEKVARLLAALVPAFVKIGGTIEAQEINGHPGAILRDRDGRVNSTFTLEIAEAQVQTIRSVINPDKLQHMGVVADAWQVLRETKAAQRDPGRWDASI